MSLRGRIETRHWNREQPASALRIDLGRVEDHRTPGGLVLLEGCEPWGSTWEEDVSCPVCRGRTLKGKRYCLYCDRCSLDSKLTYPGEPIDSRLNEGWTATPTVVEGARRPGLKGGLGDRVGKRRRGRQKVAMAKGA